MPDEVERRIYEIEFDATQAEEGIKRLQADQAELDAAWQRSIATLTAIELKLRELGATMPAYAQGGGTGVAPMEQFLAGEYRDLAVARERIDEAQRYAASIQAPTPPVIPPAAIPTGAQAGGAGGAVPFAVAPAAGLDRETAALTQLLSLQERIRFQRTGVRPDEYALISQQAPLVAQQIDRITGAQLRFTEGMRMVGQGAMTWEEFNTKVATGGVVMEGAARAGENHSNVLGRIEFSMLRSLIVYGLMWQSIDALQQALGRLAEQELAYNAATERAAYITGQSVDQMGRAAQQAGQLATQYGRAPTEGYQAFVSAARITPDPQAQQQMVQQALQLSTITMAPVEESLQRLITLQRQWGTTVQENQQVLDIAAVAYKTTNVDTNAFIDTLAKGSATGKAYGLSLQEMAGYMAAFAQTTGNFDPSRATQFFDAIAQLTESAAKQRGLIDLGIAVFDVNQKMLPLPTILDEIRSKWSTWNTEQQTSAAILLVNRRYLQDFFAFMQGYDLVAKNVDNFNNSQGEATRKLQETNKELDYQIGRLKETAWNEFTKSFIQAAGGAEKLSAFVKNIADNMAFIVTYGKLLSPIFLGQGIQAIMEQYRYVPPPGPQPGSPEFIGPVRPAQQQPGLPVPPGGVPPTPAIPEWLAALNQANLIAAQGLPRVEETKSTYDQLVAAQEQANQKAQQMVALFAQQTAASHGLAGNQQAIDAIAKTINDKYKDQVVYLQAVNGELVRVTGAATLYVDALLRASNIQVPSMRVGNLELTPQRLAQEQRIANQLAQAYVQQIQASNLPADQQAAIIQKVTEQWQQTAVMIRLANGELVMLTGAAAAFLGESEQILAQWDQIQKAQQYHPTIETMPELTGGRAQQLQQYLVQYENLLRSMGVQQTPQEYLIFGAGGGLYRFVTSSEAMNLAMALLRDEIAKNTEQQKETLRGHYNIPTDFGYQPPTVWEAYNRYGSALGMGPVNYPWNFPDAGKKTYLDMVPTGGADFLQTTMGASAQQQQTFSLNTTATQLNTAALDRNTASRGMQGYAYDAASGQLVKQFATQYAYDAASGALVAQAGTQNQLVALADRMSKQYGLADPNILRALIQAESGWNPNAVGDRGNSIGLLQLNRAGGSGAGYSVQQLMDPATNLSIMMPQIAAWYQRGVAEGLSGAALARYVGQHAERPAAGNEENYYRAYGQVIQQFGPQFTTSTTEFSSAVNLFSAAVAQQAAQPAPAGGTFRDWYQRSVVAPLFSPAPTVGAAPVGGPSGYGIAGGIAGQSLNVQGMPDANASLQSIRSSSLQLSTQMPPLSGQQIAMQAVGNGLMASMIGLLGIIAIKVGQPPIVNVTVTGQAGGAVGAAGGAAGRAGFAAVYGTGQAGAGRGGAGGSLPYVR